MVDTKITDLSALSAPVGADVVYIVDTSDTTDDPAGSSRKVTVTDLLKEGLESVLLNAVHSIVTSDGSGVATRVGVSDRSVAGRATGNIITMTGRTLLDEVLRGDASGTATADNFQPHYRDLWNGTNGDTDTLSLTWPTNGSSLGVVSVFDDPTADTQATMSLPTPSAALEGDKIYIYNRKSDSTSSYLLIQVGSGGSGTMADEDTLNQHWRLHYGDYVGFVCKQNETTSAYHWYQCAGTSLDERYERFETATSMTFGNGTQYTPGKAHIDVTADGQTITLPSASTGRRYQYAIRNYNSGVTFTTGTTVAAAGSDTITWDPSDTGNTQAVITSGTHAFTRLETHGDGVWYEMYQSGTVTYS